jgi:hypothetical protein
MFNQYIGIFAQNQRNQEIKKIASPYLAPEIL